MSRAGYRYLNVGSDPGYGEDAPVIEIVARIAAIADLVQVGPRLFANREGAPWVRVRVVHCDAAGNYADDDGPLERANLVELTCADGDVRVRRHFDDLALVIARALGWDLVDDDDVMTLRFGAPVHGWLEVELIGPEGASRLAASDVPGDSLAMLVGAALDLIEGRDARDVTWFLEPEELTWTLQRRDDRVEVHARGAIPLRGPIGTTTIAALVRLVWRAMRRLELDPAWAQSHDGDGRVWSHRFPTQALAALGERLH